MQITRTIRPIDYKHSNINLVASILQYYGIKSNYETLKNIDYKLDKRYKNVVLIVLDGLGDKILTYHSEFGIFNQSKIDVISSIFPPTTVAAINTFESGLAPCEHGWLGWSLYFHELDKTIDIFPSVNTLTGEKVDYTFLDPRELISYESIFSKIKNSTNDVVKCYQVYPSTIEKYSIDSYGISVDSANELFTCINNLCNEKGEKFIYGYWPYPDGIIHQYGTKSELVTAVIDNLENNMERVLDNVDDTIFILTADHGLIDNKSVILNDYPSIMETLIQRPDIESRCMNFIIKPSMKDKFVKEFNKIFKDSYVLYSKEEIIKECFFGDYKPHPKFYEFLGDYVGIAKSDVTIFFKDEKRPLNKFKASHAGMTMDEILVPLIILEKRKNQF